MERELFDWLRRRLRRLGRRRQDRRQVYTDATILEVYLWSVIHDRPVSWACVPAHWPPGVRRGPLPSQSCVSRRLACAGVRRLLARLDRAVRTRVRELFGVGLSCSIDGHALLVAAHSRDREARWGRIAGGMGRGYKLHLVRSVTGVRLEHRLTPLNTDEREMARRMLRSVAFTGYILADKNYDSGRLFDAAGVHGGQLVVPRRKGAHRGLAHGRQAPGRLRSKDLLENPGNLFGRELHQTRAGIERYFGTLRCTPGLLGPLPAWVRTRRRTERWVLVKLILADLRHIARRWPEMRCVA